MIKTKEQLMEKIYIKDNNGNLIKTKGWWKDSLFEIYECVNNCQNKNNVEGNLAEIGVYAGKSLLALYNLKKSKEKVIALDLFKNESVEFIKNKIVDCFGSDNDLFLIKENSYKSTKFDNFSPIRLFYIDGGHSFKIAYNDLLIAEKNLSEEGLIFLDDYDNPRYGKDIREAIKKFTDETEYSVVFTSTRTVFLCKDKFKTLYLNFLKENLKDFIIENDEYFLTEKFTHIKGDNSYQNEKNEI